jgi:hypothetical protein
MGVWRLESILTRIINPIFPTTVNAYTMKNTKNSVILRKRKSVNPINMNSIGSE